MRDVLLRTAAQQDIDAIWDYSTDEWSPDQADTYVLAIRNAITLIALNPMIGSDRSVLAKGLRKFNVRSHAIYYINMDDHLDIVRVLHQRMDASSQLAED